MHPRYFTELKVFLTEIQKLVIRYINIHLRTDIFEHIFFSYNRLVIKFLITYLSDMIINLSTILCHIDI